MKTRSDLLAQSKQDGCQLTQMCCPLIRRVNHKRPQDVNVVRDASLSDGEWAEPVDTGSTPVGCDGDWKEMCGLMMEGQRSGGTTSAAFGGCGREEGRGEGIPLDMNATCLSRRGPNLHASRQKKLNQPRRRVSSVDSLKITENIEDATTSDNGSVVLANSTL